MDKNSDKKIKSNICLGEQVRIFDTTLRDGEQTPGVSVNPEKKIKIAFRLDELGVDAIEAGFPIVSIGERESIKTIAKQGLKASLSLNASHASYVSHPNEIAELILNATKGSKG